MLSYYDCKGHLKYDGRAPKGIDGDVDGVISGRLGTNSIDIRRWKQPPHVALANLQTNDSRAVFALIRTYGVLGKVTRGWTQEVKNLPSAQRLKPEDVFGASDASLAVAGGVSEEQFSLTPMELQKIGGDLRLAWRGDLVSINQIERTVQTEFQFRILSIHRGQPVFATRDLSKFLFLLFLIDYQQGKTKICANAACASPYFVQQRKDQQYCTRRCAVLINVQRFRKKASVQRKRLPAIPAKDISTQKISPRGSFATRLRKSGKVG